MLGLWEQREQLQKRLEEESHETRLHCNQRKARSKHKQRKGESGRGAQSGQTIGCDLNLGKATGNASRVVCVPVCILPMRDTFFPKRNQEMWLQAMWWADGFPWPDAFGQKGEGHSLKRRRLDFWLSATESTGECPLHTCKHRKAAGGQNGPSDYTCAFPIVMVFPLMLSMPSTPPPSKHIPVSTWVPFCPAVTLTCVSATCMCWEVRHSAEQEERILHRKLLSTKDLPCPLSSSETCSHK